MRINWNEPGVAISGAIHVALLMATLVAFSSAPPLDQTVESLQVEMITPSELTALTKGSKMAKEVLPEPKPQAAKVAEIENSKPVSGEAKTDTPPPTPAKPPEPDPEPKPDPKPAPKAEAKREPVKTEAKPQAETPTPLPEPKPETKPEPKPAPKPDPKPAVDPLAKLIEQNPTKPVSKPQAAPKTPETTFNPSEIEKLLLSKDKPQQTASTAKEVSNKASAGTQTGTAAKLSLTQQDMIAGILKEQIWKCWNAPSWLAGGENLRPTIKFNLKPDGALDGLPENAAPSDDPAMRTMAESAMRAIQECAPYKIPAQFKAFYEDWKKFSVTFDMKEVL